MNRILLVDDDLATRALLASMLVEMGYGVTSVASGDEGLRYLYSEESCDIVLSDILMPGMSGLEFAQRTHDVRPGLPLIFITGLAGGIDLARKAGAVAVSKPIRHAELTRALQDALAPRNPAMLNAAHEETERRSPSH